MPRSSEVQQSCVILQRFQSLAGADVVKLQVRPAIDAGYPPPWREIGREAIVLYYSADYLRTFLEAWRLSSLSVGFHRQRSNPPGCALFFLSKRANAASGLFAVADASRANFCSSTGLSIAGDREIHLASSVYFS